MAPGVIVGDSECVCLWVTMTVYECWAVHPAPRIMLLPLVLPVRTAQVPHLACLTAPPRPAHEMDEETEGQWSHGGGRAKSLALPSLSSFEIGHLGMLTVCGPPPPLSPPYCPVLQYTVLSCARRPSGSPGRLTSVADMCFFPRMCSSRRTLYRLVSTWLTAEARPPFL